MSPRSKKRIGRYKPFIHIRIPEWLAAGLRTSAKKDEEDMTKIVQRAVQHELSRRNVHVFDPEAK